MRFTEGKLYHFTHAGCPSQTYIGRVIYVTPTMITILLLTEWNNIFPGRVISFATSSVLSIELTDEERVAFILEN